MPAGYGYLDPFDPLDSLTDKYFNDSGRDHIKEPIEYSIKLPEGLPVELPPGLTGNRTGLTIGAMPSIHFGNSVLVGYSYIIHKLPAVTHLVEGI